MAGAGVMLAPALFLLRGNIVQNGGIPIIFEICCGAKKPTL